MAAVSLREGRLLFPPGFAIPELTLHELQGYFRDYSATTIFQTGHLRHTLYSDHSAEDVRRLLKAWLRLPLDHGCAWAAHRLRLSAMLFGWDRTGRPDFQVFSPCGTSCRATRSSRTVLRARNPTRWDGS